MSETVETPAKPSLLAQVFPSSRNSNEGSMTIKLLAGLTGVVTGGEAAGLTADQVLMITQLGCIALGGRCLGDIVRAFRH